MVPRITVNNDAAEELFAALRRDGRGYEWSGFGGGSRGRFGLSTVCNGILSRSLSGGVVSRRGLRISGEFAQGLELLVVFKAFAVNNAFKGVHGNTIRVNLVFGSLRLDTSKKLFAKSFKPDRGAIVGLVTTRRIDELLEGSRSNVLPVGSVIAGSNGENLSFARASGDFGEDTSWADGRILEWRTNTAEKISFLVEGDFVIFEAGEEKLALVGGDGGVTGGVGIRIHEIRNDGVLLRKGSWIGRDVWINNRDGALGIGVFILAEKPLKHKLIIA